MRENRNEKYLTFLLYWLYLVFLVSLTWSFNAFNSISIALILILGIAKNKITSGKFLILKVPPIFLIGCILFYLLQLISLLYTENQSAGWRHIEVKSTLIFIPLALGCCDFISERERRKLMPPYVFFLVLATIFCLVFSIIKYYKTGDISSIFYHQLVSPLEHHAIQFSILVFIGLVYLLERVKKSVRYVNITIQLFIIVYLIIVLILLSSKLIIAYFFFYLFYYLLLSLKGRKPNRFAVPLLIVGALSLGALILLTPNPVSKRFKEITSGDINIIYEKNFNAGIYFNGLQFRLLQWRFVKEILDERNAWLIGLTPGDAQKALDQKYISTGMYIGDSSETDHGFLGYNSHNQFFESVLQTGIVGLAAFMMVCYGTIKMALKRKKNELSFVVILLLIYSLNESVFETQYGLMIFLFFPLFFYKNDKRPIQ